MQFLVMSNQIKILPSSISEKQGEGRKTGGKSIKKKRININ